MACKDIFVCVTSFLILTSYMCVRSPYKHTDIFLKNWISDNGTNINSYFYDNRTFGYEIYANPCTLIENDEIFLNHINENVNCSGIWCVNHEFGNCNKDNECYNVTHVIEKYDPNFTCVNCLNIVVIS